MCYNRCSKEQEYKTKHRLSGAPHQLVLSPWTDKKRLAGLRVESRVFCTFGPHRFQFLSSSAPIEVGNAGIALTALIADGHVLEISRTWASIEDDWNEVTDGTPK